MEAAAPSEAQGRTWLHAAALVLVLALAAALRFWGLRWGLPNALHNYSYHPDEFLIIGAAFATIYLKRTWNPGFYNYPSLYIYLSALALAVASGWHVALTPASIYLIPRVVTALMGVGAVAATYWAGRVMFGEGVGLLAALVICVAPLHVQHSHFATVDAPSTLFVALALGFAGLILKRGSWRDYVLAGVMSGLAAGTKYNAGLVMLSPIAAHFLREGFRWSAVKSGRLWAIVGCALAAFVISTPGSVLATSQFLYGLTYEMHHAAEGHGLVFAGTGNGFVYTFASSLCYGLGPFLAFLLVVAVLSAARKRSRQALAILAFIIPYYALISFSHVRFARYALPLFPAGAVMIGWLMCEWFRGRCGSKSLVVIWRCLWIALCGGSILIALFCSMVLDALFALPDPRDQAAQWVFKHVQKGSAIGLIESPWFYSPPLTRSLGFGALEQRQDAAREAPYRLVVLSPPQANRAAPDWLIVSDYETEDAERLRDIRSIPQNDRVEVDRILGELDWIAHCYTRRDVFGGSWGLLGWGPLPHDMRYPDPMITIYERRK